MDKEKTYTVIGPFDADKGYAPTIVTVEADSFDLINGGPMLMFKNVLGSTVALHHLAPSHTVTLK
jgi:hypothetical protein